VWCLSIGTLPFQFLRCLLKLVYSIVSRSQCSCYILWMSVIWRFVRSRCDGPHLLEEWNHNERNDRHETLLLWIGFWGYGIL